MFWRILRRSLFANRGRLLVILLALGAGAAITAALLNLQVDAKRRMTTEFRSFGANVLLTPAGQDNSPLGGDTFESSVYERIPKKNEGDLISKAALLYGTAMAAADDQTTAPSNPQKGMLVVVTGYEWYGGDLSDIFPSSIVAGGGSGRHDVVGALDREGRARQTGWKRIPGPAGCDLGETLAKKLSARVGQDVSIWKDSLGLSCNVRSIRRFGSPEDSQLFISLAKVQRLFEQPDRVSAIALNVPGNPKSVASYISRLQASLPSVAVGPVRQFTEVQSKVYGKISGILTATVVVVLVLTALCVMAAMTNVAMERKNDVGLMKAIGGSVRRVLRLFLAEAALLGLAGGLLGAAAGILISMALGKAVFGLAARPRLIVYPVSVALTVVVAILAAFPLRRLVHIRPASVFRGEE